MALISTNPATTEEIKSYPEFIYSISSNKTRVVVAGSHGKSTISAMILHVMNFNNI